MKYICKHEELMLEHLMDVLPETEEELRLLFKICSINGIYERKGDNVDYAFIENKQCGILYIFFEPSDSKADWRNNFAFARRPYNDMEIEYKVHGGFLKCWKTIDDLVIEKITEKGANGQYKWNNVVVVGYSHGGALAALCHECVWFHRPDLRAGNALRGYGFEAPRVFGGLWIPAALRERWRTFKVYRNKNDLVTHMPPILFGFRHVGEIVKIGKDSKCGPIGAHYRTWVRIGLGEKIKDVEAEIKRERERSKNKNKCVCAENESES